MTTSRKKPGSLFKQPAVEEIQETTTQTKSQTTKRGKHLISGLFEPATYSQFGILAAELRVDKRELLREALNDLFTKHNKPPIA